MRSETIVVLLSVSVILLLSHLLLVSSTVPVTELISVSSVPSRDKIVNGVVNEFDVSIDITMGERGVTVNRTPFELVIVLDKSGSMEGDQLEHSKSAITQIIKNLQRGDRLHFITYSDSVDVIFEDGNKDEEEKLISMVSRITTNGGTNLHSGLKKGYEILSTKDKKIERNKRVFIFSDGLLNVGVTDPQIVFDMVKNQYQKNSIITSSFGIGADFDSNIMMGIAQYSAGDYLFIESSKDIEKVVLLGLKGLSKTIGKDSKIVIRGANGAVVKKVYGYTTSDILNGINLGDLRENDRKKTNSFLGDNSNF